MKNILDLEKMKKNRTIKFGIGILIIMILTLLTSIVLEVANQNIHSFFSISFLVLLSLFANFVLFIIIKNCYRIAIKEKINKYYIVFTVGVILICALIYAYSISERKMIYFWDFSNYYKIQTSLSDAFNTNILVGIRKVVASLLLDDYSCFICVFCAAPFVMFSNMDVNMYIIEYAILGVIPLILTFSLVFYKLISLFNAKRPKLLFSLSMISLILFPLFHYSALIGQPDVYGLIFVNIILLLTIDFDFKKMELDRLSIIFISTVALILTRRWYMYWVVSYYFFYAVLLIIQLIKKKSSIKNFLAFGIGSILACLLLLFPMFYKMMGYNYSDHYQMYNVGGLSYEITNQINYLGLAVLVMALLGLVSGICIRKTRFFTICMLGTLILEMVLFTRVQNTGYHQSLIFLPSYIVLLFMLYYAFTSLNRKVFLYITTILSCILIVINFIFSLRGNIDSKIFTNISLKPIVRDDIEDICRIDQFIKENVTVKNSMYIIPHSIMYNPDIFRDLNLPNSLEDEIAYGSAVLGTHQFPTEFFTAKYVLTCDPLEDLNGDPNSIVKNLNTSLNELVTEGKFKLVKKFDFTNGYTFFCYERIQSTDLAEVSYLKQLFLYQSSKFPEMFEGVLDSYAKTLKK